MTGLLISKLAGVSLLVGIITLSVLLLLQFPSLVATAHATAANTINNPIKMTKQQSFVDSSGRLNVIGVVDNNGKIPVTVTVSLNTIDNNGKFGVNSATTTTNNMITDPTYGSIIYPFTGAPFKFIIAPNQSVKGTAFISSIKQVLVPYYNVIRLNYSNMPSASSSSSSSKAMVG